MTDPYAHQDGSRACRPLPEGGVSALLPCPFCGGEAYFCKDNSYGACLIGCSASCNAEPCCDAPLDQPEKAIAAWNARHPAALPEALGVDAPVDLTPPARGRETKFDREINRIAKDAIEESLAAVAKGMEAFLDRPSPSPSAREETAWLVEEDAGGFIHWIALAKDGWPRTDFKVIQKGRRVFDDDIREYRTPVARVKDASEALRFARREDAEAFIALFDSFLLNAKATEHQWQYPSPPAREAGEVTQAGEPCDDGIHCCCCGPTEPCCDCGQIMPSKACIGERCWCGAPAAKKVGEEILFDDPLPQRHNLTSYVCGHHYAQLMGPVGAEQVGLPPAARQQSPARPAAEAGELNGLNGLANAELWPDGSPKRRNEAGDVLHGCEMCDGEEECTCPGNVGGRKGFGLAALTPEHRPAGNASGAAAEDADVANAPMFSLAQIERGILAEREACAEVADAHWVGLCGIGPVGRAQVNEARRIAAAIRARPQSGEREG